MPLNTKISKSRVFTGVVLLSFLLLAAYGTLVEPKLVTIHRLRIDGMVKALKGKVAVHLSDLHICEIGRREKRILEIIEAQNPDFIFLTGDYVTWDGDYDAALSFLSRLKAKIGIWAVMGDYDYSCSRKSCLFCHEKDSGRATQTHSVHFLRNSVETVGFKEGNVLIGGIDGQEGKDLGRLKGDIVLSHNPLTFEILNDDQKMLILAGDTHGGQVPIPSWLWEILGYEKCARYNQGFFQKGRKKMYVSRGVGMSHFPLRILRRPEVVVLYF